MGLSTGLDIATRALRAQQLAVNVASHNIANVNTPGFSRQEARLTADAVAGVGSTLRDPLFAQVGHGVIASDLRRIRDVFIDLQIRQVSEAQGRFRTKAETLRQVETIFNEPSDIGLNALFGQFWTSWGDLSNQPESIAARTAVVENGSNLAAALKRADQQLRLVQSDIDRRIGISVNDMNSIGTQIAALNEQIRRLDVTGNAAVDLKDERDLLLDKLASFASINYVEQLDGSLTVYLGSQVFVAGKEVLSLTATPNAANKGYVDVKFADGSLYTNGGGELQGLQDLRDTVLAKKIADLGTLATNFMSRVNLVHRVGRGLNDPMPPPQPGFLNFFSGADIATMAVESSIAADPNKIRAAVNYTITATTPTNSANIAVSGAPYDRRPGSWAIVDDGAGNLTATFTPNVFNPTPPPDFVAGSPEAPIAGTIAAGGTNTTLIPGVTLTAASLFGAGGTATLVLTATKAVSGPGDGSNALNIADLRPTVDSAYHSYVTSLGVNVQEAAGLADNQDVLVKHLEGLRQSISGVNLDEEMTNLVKFQHAYNAAARFLTVVDEMLDQLILRTGTFGR